MNGIQRIGWLAAAAALSACSGVRSRVKEGRVETTIDQTAQHGRVLEAIGIGASDPALPSDTQRKALARDAAIVKAQYEMLSMVKGVQLQGGITVDRAIERDSSLETKILASIQGAEIVKSEFTADNGCVVTIRLPKSRLEKMMGVRFE
jgi:hypothetical protein